MAPAELSPPGTATYASDRLNVGDGTWDYEKNTFLLPPLVPVGFDMLQYNGMGNRFSSMAQYQSLIMGHGILATMAFLFLIPAAVMTARFYTGRPGYAVRYHAYLNVLAVGLATVAFILGWFAVGPNRSLTNPHHGIGVTIYTLLMLQAIGGSLIRNIRKMRSFRVTLHQWNGRIVAILGMVQVPLGLALYGSPKYCFILYGVWTGLLALVYFILSYRHAGQREEYYASGARSEAGFRSEAGRSRTTRTDFTESEYTERTGRTSRRGSDGDKLKWLGPLAAGAGAMAFWKRKKRERSMSRTRSRSRVRSRSRGASEVLTTRRGSPPSTYLDYDEEKRTTRTNDTAKREDKESGGFMKKLAGLGAVFGAAKLMKKSTDNSRDSRRDETAYSAVSTETPGRYDDRRRSSKGPSTRRGGTVVSDYTDETSEVTALPRSPLMPGPRGAHSGAAAAAMSAAAPRPGASNGRPVTPPQSHRRNYSRPEADSLVYSDYSSFRDDSPSRRSAPQRKSSGVATADAAGGGFLAGLGLGWLTNKMKGKGKANAKEDDRSRYDDEESRVGDRPRRYTSDGSPSRRNSRRPPPRSAPSAVSEVTTMTESSVEPRPATGYGAGPGGPRNAAPPTMTPAGVPMRSRSQSRHEGPYAPMAPPDSADDAYQSASGGNGASRRRSERRQRDGQSAAADAVASASRLASNEARRWGTGNSSVASPSQTVSVKMQVHGDRDKVTLRRIPPGEAAAAASSRRERSGSVSSLSANELSPNSGGSGRQRYRRDSSMRRAEAAAERAVNVQDPNAPLPPPNPAFARGGSRQPSGSKNSTYSGPASGAPPPPPGPPPPAYNAGEPPHLQMPGGPPPPPPPAGQAPQPPRTPVGGLMSMAGQTQTSLGSHGTWSGMSPSSVRSSEATSSPAARRKRRRQERGSGLRPSGTSTVDYD